MESPFYRGSSSSNGPFLTRRPSRYYYNPATNHPGAPPKVVNIPVHFVGLERSRSDSAVKIQKAFRGYLVRKSARKIAAIRAEVNELEQKIGAREIAELMRRDAKERVKINEMLMSLLLKLDSVPGLDFGIRQFRKGVIKKVIALQEAIDALAVEPEIIAETEVAEAENLLTEQRSAEEEAEVEKLPTERSAEEVAEADNLQTARRAEEVEAENLPTAQSAEEAGYVPHSGDNSNPEGNDSSTCDCGFLEAESAGMEETKGETENAGMEETKGETANSSVERGSEERDGVAMPESDDPVALQEETMNEEEEACSESSKEDSSADPEGFVEEEGEEGTFGEKLDMVEDNGTKERERKSREMLERMLEDNERMMGMMVELFQRNELQTRLLSSLSQRVEQLERAFVCERLRRMKKKAKRSDGAFGGCLDPAQERRKCGKK